MDRVEEAACEEEELVRVLRVACLQSVVNSGLKPKVLESYRRTIAHSYGYKHVMSLYNLDKVAQRLPSLFIIFLVFARISQRPWSMDPVYQRRLGIPWSEGAC